MRALAGAAPTGDTGISIGDAVIASRLRQRIIVLMGRLGTRLSSYIAADTDGVLLRLQLNIQTT